MFAKDKILCHQTEPVPWYPKKMIFKDVLKKGSGTEFIIDSVNFNAEIPKHIFSKASLRR